MSPAEIAKTFQSVPAFSDLEDRDLQRLAEGCDERKLSSGEVIFREGEQGDEMYVILEGEFQVFVTQKTIAYEKEIARLGKGAFFGEIAVLTEGARTASVRALNNGLLLVLKRSTFLDIMKESPSLAVSVCRALGGYVTANAPSKSTTPYVKLADYPNHLTHCHLLPLQVFSACQAIVLDRRGDKITVGMVDPQDANSRSFVEQVLHPLHPQFVFITEKDFRGFMSNFTARAPAPAIQLRPAGRMTVLNLDGKEERFDTTPAGERLHEILSQAAELGASNAHLEPLRDGYRARLRIDGKLVAIEKELSREMGRQMISKLKMMSQLDVSERRIPQHGSLSLRTGDAALVGRLSTLLSEHGEKAALRLVDERERDTTIRRVVVSLPASIMVRELLLQDHGLLLVTGPTGAGKTTTLYAALRTLWEESNAVNIMTIEDPVDRPLDYATQVPVDGGAGLSHGDALKAILRQDPDVIMTAALPDAETLDCCLEATTSGRLVLAALPTRSALETLVALRRFDADPQVLASALIGVLSQRLVPRTCSVCAEPVDDADEHVARLVQLGILPEKSPGLRLGKGCDVCRFSGEKGQVAVFEILAIDDAIREKIESGAPRPELEEAFKPRYHLSVERYAKFLLLEGLVSPRAMCSAFPAQPAFEDVLL